MPITTTFKIKDPGSAITHFIGLICVIIFAVPLFIKANRDGVSMLHFVSLVIFSFSMILLYGASTIYHTFDISPDKNVMLKKIDHMMIFILIAGSYTPICIIALGNNIGWLLLFLVWFTALTGIIIKACWIHCPKWFSSVIYIIMGWMCLIAFTPIVQTLSRPAFNWLLAGGVLYTIGGVIYALKLPIFNARFKHFGSHEIFHLFVMAGSLCHYILIYQFLA